MSKLSSNNRIIIFFLLAFLMIPAQIINAQTHIFINEIHYDNNGTDAGEALEVAGPAGTDLTGWSIELYNGSGGALYNTTSLSGTIPNLFSGYGVVTVNYPVNGLQNGAPDGIALINSGSAVVQFLSYEGSFTATDGTANGLTSTDIGVSESGATLVGHSMQLSGTGSDYEDFTWNGAAANTFGAYNTGQTFNTGIFINEIHYDNNGTDAGEALEVAGPAGTDLTGWSIELYNGSGGALYNTTSLSGTIPNLFSGYGVVTVNYPVNGLQNGAPDGIALINSGSAVVQFLSYEGSFTATDGTANGLTSTDIGVSESGATLVGHSMQLSGTGSDYEDFTWNGAAANTFGASNTGQSFGSGAESAPSIASTTPTNSATNIAVSTNIDINFNENVSVAGTWYSISGASSGAHTAVVSGGPSSFVLNPDVDFTAGEVVTVTIYAIQVTDIDADDPPDNMAADYNFTFSTSLPASGWIINEVHADPASGLTGDANGDGTRDSSDDEFVEIVNNTGGSVDIAGWTLADGYSVRHTFPAGTVLTNQSAVVVFGGDTPTGDFGYAIVQTASTGALGLNNSGDTVTLNNGVTDVATCTYGSEGGNDQSLTRDPDITGTDTFVKHSTATGSGGALFSPGSMIDGSPFPGAPIPPPVLEIYEIQGSGLASPYDGQTVTTEDNVVTALAPDGFFIQIPTASSDGDPNTSDGIFVYTITVPTVSIGDIVNLTGVVDEYYEFTEITSPVINVIGTGVVPTAVIFDGSTPSSSQPQSAIEYEKYEGMLVSISGGVVSGPNQYFATDPIAEAYISAGPNRPYREIGAEYPGLGGSIPIWDGNPEVFELDPDKLGLPNITINGGSIFDAVGVIGYEYGGYELWPTELTIDQKSLPIPVPDKESYEYTVGSLNMYRLFDDIANSGTTVASAVYAVRLSKLSKYIREVLKSPDILAAQEVEDINVLQDLAAKITTDDGSIVYTAYLKEGNDIGGIDVGFLVNENRVKVDAVTQLGKDETFIDPSDSSVDILHDRPPLLLEGSFIGNSIKYPIAVMAVHIRSLSGIETIRVQTKRLNQAQSIAAKIQDLQTVNPDIHLAVTGDFNAFEFTDGYVDVIGHILGDFDPTESMLSGTDLVKPNLTNQILGLPAEDRYSFIFGGSAQVLDHALTTRDLSRAVTRIAYGRGNIDAAVVYSDDDTVPTRSSDHDGLVMYINAAKQTYKIISGYVKYSNDDPIEGVEIEFTNSGLTATTDVDGYYEQFITKGWHGTSTPSMEGFYFSPSSYTYTGIQNNIPNQDFVGTKDGVLISGYIKDKSNNPIEGVDVTFSNGGATVSTNATGYYVSSVSNGWSGASTATKDGWTFDPVSFTYPVVTSNQIDQNYTGTDLSLGINEYLSSLPISFTVLPAYPNPFNPITTITYGLDTDSKITVNIYDITGQLVTTLLNTEQTLGWHSVLWNGTNNQGKQVPAGIYLSKIISDNNIKTIKLMLLK